MMLQLKAETGLRMKVFGPEQDAVAVCPMALGLVPDLRRAVDSAGMQPGDDLWLVGVNEGALGGSLASDLFDLGATWVPTPLGDPLPRYRSIHASICDGKVTAAHDCSEGGIAVAVIINRHGFSSE